MGVNGEKTEAGRKCLPGFCLLGGHYLQGGKAFYVQPMDTWNLEDYLFGSGLAKEDILSVYSLGSMGEREGYFVFYVPEDGKNFSFLVMAGRGEGDSILFQEGTVLLDDSLLSNSP